MMGSAVGTLGMIALFGSVMIAMSMADECNANSTADKEVLANQSASSGKTEVILGGRRAWAWASSELEPDSGRYAVSNAFDGDVSTAWVEGAEHAGVGESLTIEFEKPVTLDGFAIRPGYVKSAKVFTANAVPRSLGIHGDNRVIGDYTVGYDIEFRYKPELNVEGFYHTGERINLSAVRAVVFSKPIEIRTIRLTVTKSLTGGRYADLAVTDFEPLIHGATSNLIDEGVVHVLCGLRNEEDFMSYLSSDVVVEDLRRKYIHSDPFEKWIFNDNPPKDYSMAEFLRHGYVDYPYFSRIDKRVRSEGDSPFDQFLLYTRSSFLDSIVLIEDLNKKSTRIIGSPSFEYGESEWLELYPVIDLDEYYQVKSLVEKPRRGGAPGAKHVVPLDMLER
jgi:hypothetical protein